MTIQECIASIEQATARLQAFRLRSCLRAESAILPRWKRRPKSFETLTDGQPIVNGTHTLRTTYLRSNYNGNDVALLQQIVEMQPCTFTFEQITAGRKYKASANQIERIRKGQL
jgi:hypothetical protein